MSAERQLMPCPVCGVLPIPRGGCIHYGDEMAARRTMSAETCSMCEQAPASTRWGFPVCQTCFDGLVETTADLEAMEAEDPVLAELGRKVEQSFAQFLAERDDAADREDRER